MTPRHLTLLLLLGFALLTGADRSEGAPAAGRIRGVALPEIHPGHGIEPFRGALAEIVALGADHVLIPVYGYVDSAASPEVDDTFEPPVGPDAYRAFVRDVVREAHAAGLRVLLIPYLNLRVDHDVDWRGNLRPPDWERWFRSYERWLGAWTRLARTERVEMFAVGAELVTAEAHPERWRALIRRTRKLYSGTLLYSANWDHYREVRFTDRLDLIGLSGYYSLPWDAPGTFDALRATWDEVRADLLLFAQEIDRPILFTEIGYPSVTGAFREPWDYLRAGPPAPDEQARSLETFIAAWRNTPELRGAFVWNYSPFRGGPEDTSYSIRGKPAAESVRRWFREEAGAPKTGNQETETQETGTPR